MTGLNGESSRQNTYPKPETLPAGCLYGEMARLIAQAGVETVDISDQVQEVYTAHRGNITVAHLACRMCQAGAVLTLENQKLGALYGPPEGKSYLDCGLS